MKIPKEVEALKSEYRKRRREIKKRLKEFEPLHKSADEEVFRELCFCLFTPQSKAVNCARAVEELYRSGLLLKGKRRDISGKLKGLVRFHNKKAAYLTCARDLLSDNKKLEIRKRIDTGDNVKTREWLVENIKGLGYKEASHFLRNIGLGKDLAILDVHIMKNLKRYGVVKKVPDSLTKRLYLETERLMRDFSARIGVPLEELDLLFWSKETGFVFK